MASLRDVKNKIGAVKKTKQITKAMNMVASAKLRGAQQRIERFAPYADKFRALLSDLASKAQSSAHPLLEKRDPRKTACVVLITSDRGLCGSFNHHLIDKAKKLAAEKAKAGMAVKFVCVGKKGRDAIRKAGHDIVLGHADKMSKAFDFTLAGELGMEVIGGYLDGRYDEVDIVYSEFHNLVRQESVVRPLLPIEPGEAAQAEGPAQPYLYEPTEEELLGELLPRFVKVQLYRGLLATSASEHAARMRAMDNATSNCDDLIGQLTLVYNKARQASITTELMDIVGGAEALKQ